MASLATTLYSVGQGLLSVSIQRALTGAGLGLCTYAGLSTMLENLISDANAQLASGNGETLAILGLGGIDTCLSIVLSACIIRITIFSSQIQIFKP